MILFFFLFFFDSVLHQHFTYFYFQSRRLKSSGVAVRSPMPANRNDNNNHATDSIEATRENKTFYFHHHHARKTKRQKRNTTWNRATIRLRFHQNKNIGIATKYTCCLTDKSSTHTSLRTRHNIAMHRQGTLVIGIARPRYKGTTAAAAASGCFRYQGCQWWCAPRRRFSTSHGCRCRNFRFHRSQTVGYCVFI